MCLLTYLPAGVMPDTDRLFNGALANDDGHGWAITAETQLIVHHGLDAGGTIEAFAAARALFPEGPALFHSRWSTGGTTDTDNCHPFYLGNDHRTVVAHNGVMFSPPKGEKRCDTRIFAESVLPRQPFGSIDSKRGRKKLEKHLGLGNKILILTVNPRYQETAYLFNESAGRWVDGTWYSNDGYLPYRPTRYDLSQIRPWWEDSAESPSRSGGEKIATRPIHWEDERCWLCSGPNVDAVTGYCDDCTTCQECGERETLCQCYVPADVREPHYRYGYGYTYAKSR